MKIALHKSTNTFFEEWKSYCEEKGIDYKVVNCYDNDIIKQLDDCDALMWHHNHASPQDVVFAKDVLESLEVAGKRVFPDHYSGWHFDNKLAQKYLFEATGIDHVVTHAFVSKADALKWAATTTFPKVFKLRRGAGSRNVWLVHNRGEAVKAIKKAFGSGFRQYDAWGGVKENMRKMKLGKARFKDVAKAFAHLVWPIQLEKSQGRERGYVYFQDFIPANTFDIRVIVIGDKAFAIKRNVRENDFRASGSGHIEFDKKYFSDDLIALSFKNAEAIKGSCVAFDYVFLDGKPLVVEVSYGFNKGVYFDCVGYWTKDLQWHEGKFNPYGWMVENTIAQ